MTVPLPAQTAFLDLDKVVRDFATQIAMDVDTFENICEKFHMTPEQGGALTEHPRYNYYLAAAKSEWTAAQNTPTRAELKAAIAVEEAIPAIYAHIHDPGSSDTSKIEAFKALGKMGRIGERVAGHGASGGEMVKITINLGADHQVVFEKPAPVIEHEALDG